MVNRPEASISKRSESVSGALHTAPLGFWLNLLIMLAMLQAWAPTEHCTEQVFWCSHTAWNEPAWFVSSLFFHWLLFPLVYRWLMRTRLGCCCVYLAVLYSLSFWEPIVWPRLAYLSHADRSLVAIVGARWPLANLYKFAAGCVLARIFLLGNLAPDAKAERPSSFVQLASRYLATPSATALALMFTFVDPDGMPLREPATMCVFPALILGLACGVDPLARLLQQPALAWLGRFSYATYMLHSAAMPLVSNLTSNADWSRHEASYTRAFFPALLVLSLLAHYGIEVPVAHYYRRPPHCGWWKRTSTRRGQSTAGVSDTALSV